MNENLSGLRSEYKLRDYQENIVNNIRYCMDTTIKKNYFICLPQGCGKTTIALAILSDLVNAGLVKKALMLSPRSNLTTQWAKESNTMFYGLNVVTNPTISKKGIEKIIPVMRLDEVKGFAITIQSFKNFIKNNYFNQKDFDIVIIDEAADLILAKDFFEKYRMSSYAQGLNYWLNTPKIFLMPYHVKEDKLQQMISKFKPALCEVIREKVEDAKINQLKYNVNELIVIEDCYINEFVEVLENNYINTKLKVKQFLKKNKIKGYEENIESLINPNVMSRLKNTYKLKEEDMDLLNSLITKYIQYNHIKKWFLYSNRDDIKRSILADQINVKKWLETEDKKLIRLTTLVNELLEKKIKIFIYSQYVSIAKILYSELYNCLDLCPNDIYLITGQEQELQSKKLEDFIENGKILIATPVFDKGTDIGGKIKDNKAIIVYTPPYTKENLFQIIGRIRGGEVYFLAYKGQEEMQINNLIHIIKKN